ncbi:hypothetical protein MMC07_004034 [Pseudocyphellaria aurata]|nr:hypothetical protein [Pseudocyphellaria aurata]
MSSTIGIGVPVPRMLPVTGTWTLPFAAYLVYLMNRVAYQRVKNKKYIGENLPEDTAAGASSTANSLELESRSHGNFVENVPFAFVVAAFAELNGANRKVLNYAYATLLFLRIAHVELGLKVPGNMGIGRPVGFWGTQTFVAGFAAYGAYLVKDYWGY